MGEEVELDNRLFIRVPKSHLEDTPLKEGLFFYYDFFVLIVTSILQYLKNCLAQDKITSQLSY